MQLKNPRPVGVVMFLGGFAQEARAPEKNLWCAAKIWVKATSSGCG